MHSFPTGYHVYRGNPQNNMTIHQPVKLMKETNGESININPYCCKIISDRLGKSGSVIVEHISREISWRRGVVVITNAQLHSTKPELRFCVGSNPPRNVSEIRDGEDL